MVQAEGNPGLQWTGNGRIKMREGDTSSNRNKRKHSCCSKLAVVGDETFGKCDRTVNSYPGP